MNTIILSYCKLKEIPLPDTTIWRVFRDFFDHLTAGGFDYESKTENHHKKNFIFRKTTASIDMRRHEWAEFTDFRVSLAKIIFNGDNGKGFFRLTDYENRFPFYLNQVQSLFREQSGIMDFSVFRSPLVRLHIGLQVETASQRDSRELIEKFASQFLPYLPNTHWEENGHYWNCRSYEFGAETPNDVRGSANKCFTVYLKAPRRVRLELRFNTRRAVAALVRSKVGKNLGLENNLKSLGRPENLNAIFWQTAIHLFPTDDRAKIVAAYNLSA